MNEDRTTRTRKFIVLISDKLHDHLAIYEIDIYEY